MTPRVTDALNTASLPSAEDNRLVLIRRLNLGRIPADVSASGVALRVEEACRRASLTAIPFEVAGPSSTAVVFANATAAILALAHRVVRNQAAAEWFWRAAIPEWQPGATSNAAWRCLWHAAALAENAPIVGARLLVIAEGAGAHAACLAAVNEAEAAVLLARCQWSEVPDRMPIDQRPTGITPRARSRWRQWADWVPVAERRRRAWLAALIVTGTDPSAAADPDLPARSLWALEQSPRSFVNPVARHRTQEPFGEGSPVRPQTPASEDLAARANADLPRTLDRTENVDATAEPAELPPVDSSVTRETTIAGGLLFAIRILNELGFPEFLRRNPDLGEPALGAQILLRLATRLRVPISDPLRATWATSETADSAARLPEPCATPWPFDLPRVTASCSAIAQRLLRETPLRTEPDGVVNFWLVLMRRWSRRAAHIGLASLVRRRADVQVTETHLDVFFSLRDLDIRIRRAGLDVDPGWVPWLGRVVQFHYD